MKCSMLLLAAACVAVPASQAAQAADFAKIGPLAPAAGLVMTRQTLQEPALELDYKVAGGAADEITFDLAQDFTSVVVGDAIYIYDYKLARLIALSDKAHNFHNDSLYGLVDAWTLETANRRFERKLLGSASVQVGPLDPFWAQSELHIVEAEDGTPTIERRKSKDGTIGFYHAGVEAASYLPSKQALTAEYGARLTRFLKTFVPLHPTIVDDIVKSGLVPARLAFTSPAMGPATGKKVETVWTLQSAIEVKAAYPLYASARPPASVVSSADPVATGLVPVMAAAIAGQAPGRRSEQDYRAAGDKALAAGHPFQAMLLTMEQLEQYDREDRCGGASGCRPMNEVGAAARTDPRTQLLVNSLQPAKDQIETALKTLREMKRDDLSNGYMLGEYEANNLVLAGRIAEAAPLFAASIKANPYMAGFYKDAGDAFRSAFDPATAWLFYDVGRALPGGADSKMLSAVTAHEADLARQHPEFF